MLKTETEISLIYKPKYNFLTLLTRLPHSSSLIINIMNYALDFAGGTVTGIATVEVNDWAMQELKSGALPLLAVQLLSHDIDLICYII